MLLHIMKLTQVEQLINIFSHQKVSLMETMEVIRINGDGTYNRFPTLHNGGNGSIKQKTLRGYLIIHLSNTLLVMTQTCK